MSITTLSFPIVNRAFLASPALLLLLLFFSFPPVLLSLGGENEEEAFARSRREMIERDLRSRGIKDPRVIESMSIVPRHLFVPEKYRPSAYQDRPLPIGEDQTISQPYVVALMTELLELQGDEKVLEVGTGSGYQAAVLSRLAKEVYTIEIIPVLAKRAKEILARLGYRNVWVKAGDGFFGWEEKGPFDAIMITASVEKVPPRLREQLREGGRLVMPLGNQRRVQNLVRLRKIGGRDQVENITGVLFVPMTGAIQKGSR